MKNDPIGATARGMPTRIIPIGTGEHKAWTDLDDKLTTLRNRLDVAFHFAAEMADMRPESCQVSVAHDHLQRFCFMVFESWDTMEQVGKLTDAYYRADIAPREAA